MLSCGGDHDKLMKDENCKVRSNVMLAHFLLLLLFSDKQAARESAQSGV